MKKTYKTYKCSRDSDFSRNLWEYCKTQKVVAIFYSIANRDDVLEFVEPHLSPDSTPDKIEILMPNVRDPNIKTRCSVDIGDYVFKAGNFIGVLPQKIFEVMFELIY